MNVKGTHVSGSDEYMVHENLVACFFEYVFKCKVCSCVKHSAFSLLSWELYMFQLLT